MKTNFKNLIIAATAGFVIVGAAAFSIGPAMAAGYDVRLAGQVINVQSWDVLNVRKWPASYSQKVGGFVPGTVVYIERCIVKTNTSDWCKIGRDDTYGWVNSRYLTIVQQSGK